MVLPLALIASHKQLLTVLGMMFAVAVTGGVGLASWKTGEASVYFQTYGADIGMHLRHPFFLGAAVSFVVSLLAREVFKMRPWRP